MQFFIIDASEQKGPFTTDEVKEMLSSGAINQSSLIWFEGLSEWAPIEKFSDLFPRSGISSSTPSKAIFSGAIFASNNAEPRWKKIVFGMHHPWRRYFARFVDFYIFGLWGFFFFSLFIKELSPELFKQINFIIKDGIFDGAILLLIWMPIEVTLISLFGTTPGKWIFGISVKKSNGSNLTFLDSARRFIGMAVSGMACGVAIIVFLANLWACKRLETDGVTSWDNAANSSVIHSSKMSWRYFLGVLAVLLSLLSLVMLRM